MSFWEIGIKQSIGKIDIEVSIGEIEDICHQLDISVFPLKTEYIDEMKELPLIHRDPFVRIIIAQALIDDLTLITRDSIIPSYPDIKVIW